jgi:hypothetical protein
MAYIDDNVKEKQKTLVFSLWGCYPFFLFQKKEMKWESSYKIFLVLFRAGGYPMSWQMQFEIIHPM